MAKKAATRKKAPATNKKVEQEPLPECFVMMPISTPDGYESEHFDRVYRSIIRPACIDAGYAPFRADEIASASLIQLKIVKALINAPMAVCDLSSGNPNVLFELGIRQAFNRPVVLIQEEGNRRIFDIDSISIHSYDKSLRYDTVEFSRKALKDVIIETAKLKPGSGNSIIDLLSMQAATVPNIGDLDTKQMFQTILSMVSNLATNSEKLASTPDPKGPVMLLSKSRERAAQTERIIIELEFALQGATVAHITNDASEAEKRLKICEKLYAELRSLIMYLNVDQMNTYKRIGKSINALKSEIAEVNKN